MAERVRPELRLCVGCVLALNSMLAGYENKLRQKAQAAMQKTGGQAT